MNKYLYLILLGLLALGSCNKNNNQVILENEIKNNLKSTIEMQEVGGRTFLLDSMSAPRPVYMVAQESDSLTTISFLNEYNYSIYTYSYDDQELSRILHLPSSEIEIVRPKCFAFISDSLYTVLDTSLMQLITCDGKNNKIVSKINLKGDNGEDWPDYFPQFLPISSNPMIFTDGCVELVGQIFKSLSSKNINRFFTEAKVRLDDFDVSYSTPYPSHIYGNNANWEGGIYTTVYVTRMPNGVKVYSYPPSHNLRVDSNSEETWVYGGSLDAQSISSIPKSINETTEQDVISNCIGQDSYGPVLYDKYRNYIYRFIYYGVKDLNKCNNISDKAIGIVVLDDKFNYLGESKLGSGNNWNINNSFVTKEGLNIEFVDPNDEDHLVFKIFNFNRI